MTGQLFGDFVKTLFGAVDDEKVQRIVIDDDPDSLVPDLLIEPRISDYLKKADPVLERLLGERNP